MSEELQEPAAPKPKTKPTARLIALALTHRRGQFPFDRYLCVPNVYWGLLPWECDLVVLAPSGWLDEIEIKISVADLRRDAEKVKHRIRDVGTHRLRFFYYAMPREVWDKVKDAPPIPDYAGVIVVDIDEPPWRCAEVVRKPKAAPRACKLTDAERFKLARLGTLRFWSRERKEKAA